MSSLQLEGSVCFLVKAYGKGTLTALAALMMTFTMVINQSLVARTFGTYTLQLFDVDEMSYLVPLLGVGLLAFAFVGRAIIISISISVIVYLLIAWAVSSNLSLTEIITAKDYALAEVARPAFGIMDYDLL